MNKPTGQLQLEFERLMVRLLQTELTADEDARLTEIITASPELRQIYVDQIVSDTLLGWTYADASSVAASRLDFEQASQPELIVEANPGAYSKSRSLNWRGAGLVLGGVIAVLLILVAPPLWGPHDNPEPLVLDEVADSESVAILIDSEDAAWEEPGGELAYGTAFRRGDRIEVQSGLVRLAFECGAGVTLQGPAELELCSAWQAMLHRGKLAAVVPDEARGFTVLTPDMQIIDLGTKFCTEVDAQGQASVHVYEGEVTVQARTPRTKEKAFLLSSATRSRFSQSRSDLTEISLQSVDSSDRVSLPSLEQLRLAIAGEYPAVLHAVPLPGIQQRLNPSVSPLRPANQEEAWLFEDFSPYATGDAPLTGMHPWIVDGRFARVTVLEGPLQWQSVRGDHSVIEIDGRDPAFPSICNRLETRLPRPLDRDFYFSFLGRYQGLDADDFFALWFDNSLGRDISHSTMPNAGIRFGDYFARMKIDHQDTLPVAGPDVHFFLVGHLRKIRDECFSELQLWVNPDINDMAAPDLQIELPDREGVAALSTLGVRMGKDTEPTDKLWLDRLRIDFDLSGVLESARPTEVPSGSSRSSNVSKVIN